MLVCKQLYKFFKARCSIGKALACLAKISNRQDYSTILLQRSVLDMACNSKIEIIGILCEITLQPQVGLLQPKVGLCVLLGAWLCSLENTLWKKCVSTLSSLLFLSILKRKQYNLTGHPRQGWAFLQNYNMTEVSNSSIYSGLFC